MLETDVLVVGAGHAGAQLAMALRSQQFAGRIMLVGDEPDLPYERPPLSKEYLAGDKPIERLLIRPAGFWAERAVEIRTGMRIAQVAPGPHLATAAGGELIRYRHLVWATGGRARPLACPGAEGPSVFTLRARGDADALASALTRSTRVAVIGGGYIGLEAAAVMRKLGKSVTLLEAAPRVLARVAAEPISRFFEAQHRVQGVDIRIGVQAKAVERHDGQVVALRLTSGERIAADAVVVGIGIVPNAEPLLLAGAEGGNGVWVDEHCRTNLPDVLAIGDVALHASRWNGGMPVRIESVQNASDMAATAARTIAGTPEPYTAVPWFWSHQYDLKLQTVGLSAGHDETVVRGDVDSRSFSLVYLKQGRVIALDCVNAVKDYVQARALVQAGARVPAARLSDTSVSLKELATA